MNKNRRLHNRRSIRLPYYDYSQAGAYFVTICCKNRIQVLEQVDKLIEVVYDLGEDA